VYFNFLFKNLIENMQLHYLSLFVLIGDFWRKNLLIVPNLPVGDILTTTLRLKHSKCVIFTIFPLQRWCTQAPLYYVTSTSPVLFNISKFGWDVIEQSVWWLTTDWKLRRSNTRRGDHFHTRPDRPWDHLRNRYWVSHGVKQLWPDVDHPHISSAEVQGRPTPLWANMACHRVNITVSATYKEWRSNNDNGGNWYFVLDFDVF
jgi:hypothetical protein